MKSFQRYPSPLQKVGLKDLVSVASECYRRGWNEGTAGNFSLRGDPGVVWVSPSGVPKGSMKAQSFIPVCGESSKVLCPLWTKPSDETPLHTAIYRKFREARFVLHVHPPSVVRTSLEAGGSLTFEGHEMAKAFGQSSHETRLAMTIWPNTQDMMDLGSRLDTAVLSKPLIILRGHGVYCWGTDPRKVMSMIEALEFLCQQKRRYV